MKINKKYFLLLIIAAIAAFFCNGCASVDPDPQIKVQPVVEPTVFSSAESAEKIDFSKRNLLYGIPLERGIVLIDREGFALGYSHEVRQPLWVGYLLCAKEIASPEAKRLSGFKSDPLLSNPVKSSDYNKSGYDRGHLAPAADMAYSRQAMRNSFYMSNISPQVPSLNRGVWKDLETKIRNAAIREGMLYVVTGPVFYGRNYKMMSNGRVAVPDGFYKVIYDITPPEKMIAFLIPNSKTSQPPEFFAISVDEVERVSGCDFFSKLPDDKERRKQQ
jgi:endonuclease G